MVVGERSGVFALTKKIEPAVKTAVLCLVRAFP